MAVLKLGNIRWHFHKWCLPVFKPSVWRSFLCLQDGRTGEDICLVVGAAWNTKNSTFYVVNDLKHQQLSVKMFERCIQELLHLYLSLDNTVHGSWQFCSIKLCPRKTFRFSRKQVSVHIFAPKKGCCICITKSDSILVPCLISREAP